MKYLLLSVFGAVSLCTKISGDYTCMVTEGNTRNPAYAVLKDGVYTKVSKISGTQGGATVYVDPATNTKYTQDQVSIVSYVRPGSPDNSFAELFPLTSKDKHCRCANAELQNQAEFEKLNPGMDASQVFAFCKKMGNSTQAEGDFLKVIQTARGIQKEVKKIARTDIGAKITSRLAQEVVPQQLGGCARPAAQGPASVTYKALDAGENNYVQKRKEAVAKAVLQKFNFSVTPDQALTIGVAFSGGGYRAFIMTLGVLEGLIEQNLYPLVSYMAGLSGSSWALSSWAFSGKPVGEFAQSVAPNFAQNTRIKESVGMPALPDADFMKAFAEFILAKKLSGAPLHAIDIWGMLIQKNILGADSLGYRLSSQQCLDPQNYPMPVYTAIRPHLGTNLSYDWFEVNPFVVRNTTTAASIPLWSFNRKFYEGQLRTTDQGAFPLEMASASFLGIFGSAFSVTINEALKQIGDKIPGPAQPLVQKLQQTDSETVQIGSKRVFCATVNNPEFGQTTPQGIGPKYIDLVDAGIDFNLPVPPLLDPLKEVDVIILFDGSDTDNKGEILDSIKAYAQKNGIEIPTMDAQQANTQPVSIFHEKRKKMIIYVPFNDPCYKKYCGTGNFAYTVEEFNQLKELSKGLVVNNAQQISDRVKRLQQSKRDRLKQAQK